MLRIRPPSSFSFFPGAIWRLTYALCRGVGAAAAVEQTWLWVFCMPRMDGGKTLWGRIREGMTPTFAVSPFIRHTAATEVLPHVCRGQEPPCQSERALPSRAARQCNVCPSPVVQEVRGRQESHSGSSAHSLLGHAIVFLDIPFCMYPVILFFSVGGISCNLNWSFRQTEFILNFALSLNSFRKKKKRKKIKQGRDCVSDHHYYIF